MSTEQSPEPTPAAGAPPSAADEPPLASNAAFDALRPPSAERLADCVHCGFCLPACPTYTLWGEEMDSPRGRIHLMALGREGAVTMDSVLVGHMDACLGCMACVTACPSGVAYDELIEATRAQIERNYVRSPADRLFRWLIFALFPYPARLRAAAIGAWLYQRTGVGDLLRRLGALPRLPARIRALEGLLPPVSLRGVMAGRVPAHTAARGPVRRRVALLTGCVQRVFFDDVNAATIRVLAAEGCEVVAPEDQGCCGAIMVHAGVEEAAIRHARATIDVFERADVDVVVVNAAGCGSTLKEYGHLLRDDPSYAQRAQAFSTKVRDITEFLSELGPRAERRPVSARVAYHDACHLAHAQGVRSQPRALLDAIPDLDLLEIPEPDLCCGSAGIYNLVQPDAAEELGRRKAGNIETTDPDAVVTANPGCTLQIRRYAKEGLPVLHPVQVLDASLRGVDPGTATSGVGRPTTRTAEQG